MSSEQEAGGVPEGADVIRQLRLWLSECPTDKRFTLTREQVEALASPPPAVPPVVWVALNGQGLVFGAYATKEQAHENTAYVVGVEVRGAAPPAGG